MSELLFEMNVNAGGQVTTMGLMHHEDNYILGRVSPDGEYETFIIQESDVVDIMTAYSNVLQLGTKAIVLGEYA
tara:strand:- start:657 stop:878 length:222 start_codon:yes stop_codon:yes gene_type:complete